MTEKNNKIKRKQDIHFGKAFSLVDLDTALDRIEGFKNTIEQNNDGMLVKALRYLKLVEGDNPIFVVEKDTLPRHRGSNGKNIKFELFVPHSRIPNCNELAKTLAAAPHLLSGKFLRDYFSYGGFAANPSLVIDTMLILMDDGLIDQKDADTVFDNVFPFNKVEWIEDAKWKEDCIKGFYSLSNNRLPNFPKKGKRTEEDAETWFETKVASKLLVKTWSGTVTANGRKFKTFFSIEKAALLDAHDGRTRYYLGNRSKGDSPMRSQYMKLPGWVNRPLRHKRGKRTNVRASAFAKMGRALRRKLTQGTAPEKEETATLADMYGEDALTLLLQGKTLGN